MKITNWLSGKAFPTTYTDKKGIVEDVIAGDGLAFYSAKHKKTNIS